MNTYNTFAEAKIANPDKEIVTTSDEWSGDDECIGSFQARRNMADGDTSSHSISSEGWKICNPADYCMTVEQFLKDGHKFVEGDLIQKGGRIKEVGIHYTVGTSNEPYPSDIDRYILRAAALEQPKQEVEQPKHTKVEYVMVTDSIFDLKEEFERGELYQQAPEGLSQDYIQIVTEGGLIICIANEDCYRKVATEITERELVIEQACKLIPTTAEEDIKIIGKLYDLGMLKPIKE